MGYFKIISKMKDLTTSLIQRLRLRIHIRITNQKWNTHIDIIDPHSVISSLIRPVWPSNLFVYHIACHALCNIFPCSYRFPISLLLSSLMEARAENNPELAEICFHHYYKPPFCERHRWGYETLFRISSRFFFFFVILLL